MKYDLDPDEMKKALDGLVAQQSHTPLVTRRAIRRATGNHRLSWSLAACLAAAITVAAFAATQGRDNAWHYDGGAKPSPSITASAIHCNGDCNNTDAMIGLVMHSLQKGAAE